MEGRVEPSKKCETSRSAGHLIGEYTNAGTLKQETIWLGDIPVAVLTNKTGGFNLWYVHTDHLNTPRRISRPSNNKLRWRWDPTPFGEGVPNENPQALGVFKYHLRFPGQYFDIETNLAYNYFRDYDSAIGRYVESDPIGLHDSVNTYAYGRGNPVSKMDPMGLATCGTGWNEPLVPDNPFGFVFYKCCADHDACYDDCLSKPSKGMCDLQFLGCMMEICKRQSQGCVSEAACWRLAATYYRAVTTNSAQEAFDRARAKCDCCAPNPPASGAN